MGFLVQFIKLLTKKSGRKIVKFVVYTILGLTALIIFWWIWSYFSVGYLIEEGEFDDVKPQTEYQGQGNSGTDFDNDYDNLAMKISKIDFDALPDDLMVSDILGTQYYIPKDYTVEMYLKLHLLVSEICGNPNVDLGGDVKVQPYMLYGVWMHENAMQIPNHQDPFEAWLTLKGLTEIKNNGESLGYAGSFGQAMVTFAEDIDPADRGVPDVAHPIRQRDVLEGSGTPALFISSVENSTIEDTDRLLTFVTNNDTSSFEDNVKYTEHFVGWTGSGIQRPSSFFLPDILASVAMNASQNFAGRSTYRGAVDNSYYLVAPKTLFAAGTLEREYTEVAAFFCSRAGKTGSFFSEGHDVIIDIITYLIETDQMDYFVSDKFILECGTANAAFDTGLTPFLNRLYGLNGQTAMLSEDILDKIRAEGVDMENGYPETKKAPIDAVYVISSGKFVMKSMDALADAILANDEYVKEDDIDDSVGSLPSDLYPDGLAQCAMDTDYDGICDRCGGSVFEDTKDGCTHNKTSKVVLPIANAIWSDLSDYHDKEHWCGLNAHSGIAHQGYDMYGNYTLRACVSGYLQPPVNNGSRGYGYHTYLVYPNKDTPKLYFSYAHMQVGSCTKPSGGNILAGEKVGLMGKTGNVTGEHLHFQVSTTPDSLPAVSINYLVKNSTFWLGNKTGNGTVDYTPYVIVGAVD